MPNAAAPVALPWYYRSPAIVIALVIFAPLGVFLLWRGVPNWTRSAKIAATVMAAVVWIVAWPSSSETKRRRASAPVASPRQPDVAPVDTQAAGSTNRPLPTEATQAAAPSGAASPQQGDALATDEPALLVPVALAGYTLVSLDTVTGGGVPNIRAKFKGANGITVELWPERSGTKLDSPNPARGVRATTVDGHAAIVETDAATKTATLSWLSGEWDFALYVHAPTAGKFAAAQAGASRIAQEAAAWSDGVLTGRALAYSVDREAHLSDLEKAIKRAQPEVAREKQQDNDRLNADRKRLLAARLAKFTGVLEDSDISVVKGVDADISDPSLLEITVLPEWEAESKDARRAAAKTLWQLWATINSPDALDSSRIKLKAEDGRKVGGSGRAGSSISVE